MPTVAYLLYDVFTDVPFTGNPLAVAIDPPGLTTEQCATMAAELGLPETIFLRTRGPDISARIFTPTEELLFAGHPTVGAAIALRDEGMVDDRLIIEEGVGPVEVTIDDGLATLTTAQPPTAVEVADPEDVARSLGLTLADLHPAIGPRGWSAGLAFTVVVVRDIDALGRCRVDLAWWGDTVALTPAAALFVLAPLEGLDGPHWRARMFAPRLGIAEDPATGSAAAAAVGVLAGVATEGRLDEGWIITQGVEMGRPSELHVGTVRRGPELVAATVGGRAVRVGRGALDL